MRALRIELCAEMRALRIELCAEMRAICIELKAEMRQVICAIALMLLVHLGGVWAIVAAYAP